jgi:hypothetical protein
MFTHPLFLIILLSISLLSSMVEIFFSPDEMNDMGIRLENRDPREQVIRF